MYIPAAFRETDIAKLHSFMQENGFAQLISTADDGAPFATHVPVYLDPDAGTHGTLSLHIARANPQWQVWEEGSTPAEALVVFSGPHAYVSPRWYAESGQANVPTWNYAAVHAYGTPRLQSAEELRTTLSNLSAQYEPADGWTVDALDDGYLERMMRGIVGVTIPIARLEGKWKMSQNRSVADRERVVSNLRESGADRSEALATASAMEVLLAPGNN